MWSSFSVNLYGRISQSADAMGREPIHIITKGDQANSMIRKWLYEDILSLRFEERDQFLSNDET